MVSDEAAACSGSIVVSGDHSAAYSLSALSSSCQRSLPALLFIARACLAAPSRRALISRRLRAFAVAAYQQWRMA